MRVVLYELRKIFEWKRVLATFIFCLVFYFLFIEFHFSVFPNGRPELDIYNIAVEMLEKYGGEMNPQDFEDFQEVYDQEVKRFNEYIQSREDFQEAGVTTYEQFREGDAEKLHDKLFFEENLDLVWELQAREWLIGMYGHELSWIHEGINSPRAIERHQEILNRDSESIFPYLVMENYQDIMTNTTRMIVLSVLMMLSPLYIKERKNRVLLLQYSTKLGRKLFHKKMIASLVAAIIVTSLQLAVIFMVYRGNQTSMFFSVDINSNWSTMTWYDMTFGHYIMLTVGLAYLMGLMMAVLVTFFSRLSPNYLTVIGVQVPIVAILFGVLFPYMIQFPIATFHPQFLVPTLYAGLIILILGLAVFQWMREKKIDINS